MQTLPNEIYRGMKVFDRTQKHIGKVDDFRFSENEDNPDVQPAELDATDRRHDNSLVENIAEAFGAEQLPEVLRDRLLTEGYIRLDTDGLFAADRYILPDQIASTTADAVILNVSKDELIKHH
jgi:hypothetical protein